MASQLLAIRLVVWHFVQVTIKIKGSASLALREGNPPVTGGFPSQRVSKDGCRMCIGIHSLQWRHNERDGVSNHQGLYCLLNRLFSRKSKKTSGPVDFPHKGQLTRKMFPFDDVFMLAAGQKDRFHITRKALLNFAKSQAPWDFVVKWTNRYVIWQKVCQQSAGAIENVEITA